MKKYFKSKKEAIAAADKKNGLYGTTYEVHKMPKGTRHHGMYYVGSFLEWLNFAN